MWKDFGKMQLNEKKSGAEISIRLLPSVTLNLVNLLSRVLLLRKKEEASGLFPSLSVFPLHFLSSIVPF